MTYRLVMVVAAISGGKIVFDRYTIDGGLDFTEATNRQSAMNGGAGDNMAMAIHVQPEATAP